MCVCACVCVCVCVCQTLEWRIELIDGSNKNGSIEFTAPDADPASFFPIQAPPPFPPLPLRAAAAAALRIRLAPFPHPP